MPITWHRSGLITVLQPPLGARTYRPVAMNDDGVVLGQAQTHEMFTERPIRWTGAGQVTELLGGNNFHTWAGEMNRGGTVVGTSDDGWHMPGTPRQSHALSWDSSGTATVLSGPGDWNSATGINDKGVVCGTSGNTDGSNMHAVLWRTG